MHRLTDAHAIEAVIGTANPAVRMKQVDSLDDGCLRVLARSPLAGFGYRDVHGVGRCTIVGGRPGFARAPSARELLVEVPEEVRPGGVSFVFLLPGVGETLRLNGAARAWSEGQLVVAVEEAFVHCPKCILRSGLWKPARAPRPPAPLAGRGPLSAPGIAEFLASAPFAVLASWDAAGTSDTSPRGDPPGFLAVLDDATIAIPDRRGNQRADTFHNLMTCDELALAAIAPGRREILHLRGRAEVTDDAALLASMALKGKAPHLALVVRVAHAELVASDALGRANPWRASAHVQKGEVPDLMDLAARHLARNGDRGVKATLLRLVGRLLDALPVRGLLDRAFRNDLASEGYDVRPRGLGARTARVREVRRETSDAVTLLLEDEAAAPFHFLPGQYFTLVLTIDGETVRRAYSASSVPGETCLALTVKRVAGGRCSNHVNEHVRAGDLVQLLGPSGSFVAPPGGLELVLVAGGSGITPMMSIARALLAREPTCRIALLYGNRSPSDILFAETLARLGEEHGERFRVRHVLEAPPEGFRGARGRLDEPTLRRELALLSPAPNAHFFVCGPEPMMRGARRVLEALAVKAEHIHEERFSPPRRTTARRATRRLPMVVEGLGRADVRPGKTLLEAGLDAGLAIPFSCAMGNCGECRVKLVSGEVELDEPHCLTAEERAQGFVLTCVARPLGPTTLRIEEEEDEDERA